MKGAFVFDGSGWGHGVGLAQYGAWDMVKYGYDYRTVLAYYFRSSEITSIGVSEPKRGDVSGDGVINADDQDHPCAVPCGLERLYRESYGRGCERRRQGKRRRPAVPCESPCRLGGLFP